VDLDLQQFSELVQLHVHESVLQSKPVARTMIFKAKARLFQSQGPVSFVLELFSRSRTVHEDPIFDWRLVCRGFECILTRSTFSQNKCSKLPVWLGPTGPDLQRRMHRFVICSQKWIVQFLGTDRWRTLQWEKNASKCSHSRSSNNEISLHNSNKNSNK